MAGSAAAVSKSWYPFPGGVKDIILEYLNVEPLMPPGRLHISKALKRPIMTRPSPNRLCVPSDREEIARSGVDFDVVGAYMRGTRPAFFRARGILQHRVACHVYITAAENIAFCEEWKAEHGSSWPCVYGHAHPMLEALLRRYDAHAEEWARINCENLRLLWVVSRP